MSKFLRDFILGMGLGFALYALVVSIAHAQTCGPQNPNCLVPIPGTADNSNRAAPTFWVKRFAPTISLSGDITGTVAASVVSKIQGKVVSGTTGTGNVVFSTGPTIDSLLITTGMNIDYLTNIAPGVRAPLFIRTNPGATIAAGQNTGLQVWTGNNPTATPGANKHEVALFAMVNGNNRPFGEGLNILMQQCGTSESCPSDFIDGPQVGLEVDMGQSATPGWAARNRAFNATTGTYAKNAVELYTSPAGTLTSALSIWGPDQTGANWFYEGVVVSRVKDIGLHFVANPETADSVSAFGLCAICDDSNSVSVIKLGNFTHSGSMIDASSGATFTGGFYRGSATGNTSVLFTNVANFTNALTIDSGNSSIQQSFINYDDRSTVKWQVGKQNDNTYIVFNGATAHADIVVNADDSVNFFSKITAGGLADVTAGVKVPVIANGSVATVLGSLGPVGSHTTVQEYLVLQGTGGALRYVPGF